VQIVPRGFIVITGYSEVTGTGTKTAIANLDVRGSPGFTQTATKAVAGTASVTGNANASVLGFNPLAAVKSVSIEFTAIPASIEFEAFAPSITFTKIGD
jgi:hypothetical protein